MQALLAAQHAQQLDGRACRRPTAEDQVTQRAQRENVELGTLAGLGMVNLWCEIDPARIVDVAFDMLGPRRAVERLAAFAAASTRLPVHEPNAQLRGRPVVYQYALRRQCAVVKTLPMGVLEYFGNSPHQAQPLGERKLGAVLVHQMVKAQGLGVVIENQRRSELGFLEVSAPKNAGVIDALQNLEFTPRAARSALALLCTL